MFDVQLVWCLTMQLEDLGSGLMIDVKYPEAWNGRLPLVCCSPETCERGGS